MDDIFPETPYTFYIDTMTGCCRMEFPKTQYHEPVQNITLQGHDLAIQDVRDYFRSHNIGMWGYPIERLDFCSPMDIHANLTTNKTCYQDTLIRDFQVIGYIPDELPTEIHPDYHDGIEDGEEDDGQDTVDAILESAGGVLMTLTGEELGKNIDSGNAVETARNYFKTKMQGKTITRQGVGDVRFSGKGWNKFKRGITTDIKKAKLLPAAPVIIQHGKHSISELFKNRKDNITRFHFFDGKVELEEEIILVGVTVGEDEFGHLFYNLNHDPDVLIEKRKAPILPGVEARGSEPSGGEHDALFKNNVNSNTDDVKKNILKSATKQSPDAPGADPDAARSTHDEPTLTVSHHGSGVNNNISNNKNRVKLILESAAIDKEAHKAASSPKNDLPEPTQAQKEAGNYRKGHVTIQGLEIAIENPAGSERAGVDPNGKKWSVIMPAHYGYVKRTKAPDGDNFDVYIGKDTDSDLVFIVDQLDTETGKFDECKGILGCKDAEEARELYCKGFSDGKGPDRIGAITELSMDAFKKWLREGDTMKPVSNAILESSVENSETIEYEGWLLSFGEYSHGWSGMAQKKDGESLRIRGWVETRDKIISTLESMVDGWTKIKERGGLEKDFFGEEIPPDSWIGFDLDGTLAEYDGVWKGYDHIGEPVPLMMDLLKRYIAEGKTVKIFTARASDPKAIPHIKAWLKEHGLGDLEVTNIKDHGMIKLYDDRAAKVIPNMGVVLEKADTKKDWRSDITVATSFEDIEKVFSMAFRGSAAEAATRTQIEQNQDAPINSKVLPLVSALNKMNIPTVLSGDLYGKDVVYVDLPSGGYINGELVDGTDEYEKALEDVKMPPKWFVIRADMTACNAFIKGRKEEPYNGPRKTKTRLIRKGGAIDREEAIAVANAVKGVLIKSKLL